MTAGNLRLYCALGHAGIGVNKKEGDGKSPLGVFSLVSGYYRKDRLQYPRSALKFSPARQSDGWCDAPENPNYNMPVELPFAGSYERMFRDDHLYDICIVLDYNLFRRRKYRGSAIFLHLQTAIGGPTEGCIALSLKDMRRLLPRLSQDVVVEIKAS